MSPRPRIEDAGENDEREEIIGLISNFGILIHETVRIATGPPSMSGQNISRVTELWNEFGNRLCDFAERS